MSSVSARSSASGGGFSRAFRISASFGSSAAASQSWNAAGVTLAARAILFDNKARSLTLPHIQVKSVVDVDWSLLKQRGMTGVLLDKDHTLTAPYSDELYSKEVADAMSRCVTCFGRENVWVLSNSAGLRSYDPHGHEAARLSNLWGFGVATHTYRKPDPRCIDEALQAFPAGTEASRVVFVGDRSLTDVAVGNAAGMVTVQVSPFPGVRADAESLTTRFSRRVEQCLTSMWRGQGAQAPTHPFLV